MDPVLLVALAVAGLLIGATGTWSPCGFSMIETIGPTGHEGGARTTLAACATFAPFAVVGGALTFGLLGLLGEALPGAGGTAAIAVAGTVAIAAAVAEARGLRIVPQVRRQLPIGWRRRLPMPLAAAGYGVLLGLGFTTFVLSYGVWALMGISLFLGDATAGLVAGIAFGVGRAAPIVALAPIADRPSGERACEAMAMRPGLLRGARAADAAALVGVALALFAGGAVAGASKPVATAASDPSVAGPALAYEGSGDRAVIVAGGERTELPGTDPAIGGPWAATIRDGRVEVYDRKSGELRGSVAAAGADGLAITKERLAVRQRDGRRDSISVASLTRKGVPGKLRRLAGGPPSAALSRPGMSGNTVVFTVGKPSRSALVSATLRGSVGKAKLRTLRASRTLSFTGPSIAGRSVAYVETSRNRQVVRVTRGSGRGNSVLRRRPGPPTLWTTALAKGRVYVTLIARGGSASIVSVNR